jgi:hypothetical protein
MSTITAVPLLGASADPEAVRRDLSVVYMASGPAPARGTPVESISDHRGVGSSPTRVVRVLVTVLALLVGPFVSPVGAVQTATTVPTSVSSPPRSSSERETTKLLLTPTESTWTSGRKPRKARSRSHVLVVSKRDENAYLKFDRAALAGRGIISAKLKLKVLRTNATDGGVVVHPTSADWSADSLSHKNRPKPRSKALNSKLRTGRPGKWMTIPLNKAKKTLDKESLAFRLSFSKRSSRMVLGKVGRAAPVLVLKTTQESVVDEDKVFAHYMPPFPISIDNRPPSSDYYATQYLTIDGEKGKHRAYGGFLRDRPEGRNALSGDWRLTDLRTDIRQAKAAGIDGFTLNILSISGANWDASLNLMKAADLEGNFEIIPNVDATISSTPTQIAAALAKLYAHKSAQQLEDEYVLSSFLAEAKSPTWWQQLIVSLEQTQHVPIKFIAVFNNPSDANMKAYAPISYGLGNWGKRDPNGVTTAPNLAGMAHALGKKWMAGLAFQDARPSSGSYAEAGNTETARGAWGRAIQDGADFVQLVSWNDYSESTAIAPSQSHGSVLLDIDHYYLDWFTYGTPPAISGDHLFLTHRIHPYAAKTTSGIENMKPTLGGTPRDTVEALVFLTSPADVTVTSGTNTRTVSLPAGVWTVLVPLAAGKPSARITRGSTLVKLVSSPYSVTLTPERQDMEYYASGS